MPVTSKTGLLPSVKKKITLEVQKEMTMEVPNFAVPAHFTLRPFAGIYNPFPYGCSVLCNHPADFEAKSMVKKARDVWAAEGKSLIDVEEYAALKSQRLEEIQASNLESVKDTKDKNSKSLFNNYESLDSRPLTPAPTLASIATKSSQNFRTRRCFTPDPPSLFPPKEKTLLLLDLRRSHSQEASFWQGDHGLGDSAVLDSAVEENLSREASSKAQKIVGQNKKKKIFKKASESLSRTVSAFKSETSRDSDSKTTTQPSSRSQTPSKMSSVIEKESISKVQSETQDSSSSEEEIIKRRGKKKKGKKSGKAGLEGDKEFKGIPDPGETQISALNGDSKENSSRPSQSDEEKSEKSSKNDIVTICKEPLDSDLEEDCKSFLNSSILKQLQRQLDQEEIDSEMNLKRKIALEEALRLKKDSKLAPQREEMKNLKKEFLPIKNFEEWLSTPRAFSRQSARFELPMDSRLLNDMTPLDYIQSYVFASVERLGLYNYVFNLYMEELEEDGDQDRKILGKNILEGLNKIMGKNLTPKQAKDFQSLIGWKDDVFCNFRTFAGISAACERLLAPQFCKIPTQKENPRHRIEIADFETLDEKLLRLKPDLKLVKMLKNFRDL